MTETKSKNSKTKQVFDVARPGQSAVSPTTKSIITTHTLLHDPMVVKVNENSNPEISENNNTLSEPSSEIPKSTRLVIKPLHENIVADKKEEEGMLQVTLPSPNSDNSSPSASESVGDETAALKSEEKPASSLSDQTLQTSQNTETSNEEINNIPRPISSPQLQSQKDIEDTNQQLLDNNLKIQKLIDDQIYFLPINTIEKRRAKRFMLVWIGAGLLLGAAWIDIALDAGLIHSTVVKPLTYFFSTH